MNSTLTDERCLAILREHQAGGYIDNDGSLVVKDDWTEKDEDGCYRLRYVWRVIDRSELLHWLGY